MRRIMSIVLVLSLIQLVSCNEEMANTRLGEGFSSVSGNHNVKKSSGKLDDETINLYVKRNELDGRGVSFLSLPGANDFLNKLDLSKEEVTIIGSWYNEEQFTGVVKFYPNRIITFNKVDIDVNLLGFIGFWKVSNGNVMVKVIGYYYSQKTKAQLIEDINAGKYKNSNKVITIYDIAKLYRYQDPQWNIFFNLENLDESNYTYKGFYFPNVPASLTGKKDTILPINDNRRLRLTSEPVNNLWKNIISGIKFQESISENASDDLLLQYFKP